MEINKKTNDMGAKKNDNEGIEYFKPDRGLEIEEYINSNNINAIHHLARYHWAKKILKAVSSKNILDCACGAGYGTYILASELINSKLTGVDYDNRAINYAKESYKRDNMEFVKGNIVTWELYGGEKINSMGSYDAIVSFDTIEHLHHREIALINIAQNLSENGVFLFSTPCGHAQNLLNPGWEHHKIEYCSKDLINLLKRFFHVVLIPDNGSLPYIEYWKDVINKKNPIYWNKTNPIYCSKPIKY